MKMFMLNKHPVIQLSDRRYVVDTGSPISFHYCSLDSLVINGLSFRMNSPVCSQADLEALTGSHIDGLIGLDILCQTGLTIDLENMILDLDFDNTKYGYQDEAGFYSISFDFFMGSYLITNDIFLGQRLKNVILDTGAPIPYISSRFASLLEKSNEAYLDYSPEFGTLQGEYLYGNLVFEHGEQVHRRAVKVGLMPQAIDMFGFFDAILGISDLTDKHLAFDFENKVVYFKP